MNTIIEKIRAEVERRMKKLHCADFVDEMLEGPSGNDGFLSFLSDLEKEEKPTIQERPVKIDIRKELASIEFMGVNDARDTETIARHFYELGRQSKPRIVFSKEVFDQYDREQFINAYKQKVSDGLEEEIREFVEQEWDGLHDNDGNPLYTADYLEYIARHIAQWQKEQTEKRWLEDRDGCFWDGVEEGKKAMKEQMMKEAVEGDIGMILHDKTADLFVRSKGYLPKSLGIKCDDKVRIIIVKEDEK